MVYDARRLGIQTNVIAGKLEITSPDTPIAKKLADEIRRRESEVIEHFTGEPQDEELPPVEPITWSEPQPLPGLPPVSVLFDYALLPTTLRRWVADISERMQPPDFAAVAAVVVLASLVGRKITIRPKRRDDWNVTPNLWVRLSVDRP